MKAGEPVNWLISIKVGKSSIKVGQSLIGNRNYFYLRQSWSNFDQVRQSGVNTNKVSNKSELGQSELGQT